MRNEISFIAFFLMISILKSYGMHFDLDWSIPPTVGAIGLPLSKDVTKAINEGDYEQSKALLLKIGKNYRAWLPPCLLHTVCYGKWHEDETKTIEIINFLLQAGNHINQIRIRKIYKCVRHSEDYCDSCPKEEKQIRELKQTPLDVALANHALKYAQVRASHRIQALLKQNGAQCLDEIQ